MANTETTFIVNLIRYMPDDKCEAYLRDILESLPDRRLERAIQIARESQAKRAARAEKPGGK